MKNVPIEELGESARIERLCKERAELEKVVADIHESRGQYEAGEGLEAAEAVRELRGRCGL